jgi:uncharacterized membrane protein (GlpM family)
MHVLFITNIVKCKPGQEALNRQTAINMHTIINYEIFHSSFLLYFFFTC